MKGRSIELLKAECLFSGSKGNCIFVKGKSGNLLVDVGSSLRGITNSLCFLNENIDSLCGALITHEHSDHIKGIGRLVLKTKIPVFATEGVAKAIYGTISKSEEQAEFCECVRIIRPGAYYEINGITFSAFQTPHDSVGSVGYVLSDDDNEKQIGIATDLGFPAENVVDSLLGCKKIIIESNHDIEMLRHGKYPDFLKERILSNFGHLSNDTCAETCKTFVTYGTDDITLFHLSEDNNTEQMAFSCTHKALIELGVKREDKISLSVAPKSLYASLGKKLDSYVDETKISE